jgi:site-specific DNA recombinase
MVKNPAYYGLHVYRAGTGHVERTVPALVDEQTWRSVGAQLVRNRKMSKKNAKRTYLLRGLVTCARCGAVCHGEARGHHAPNDGEIRYYRCPRYGRRDAAFGKRCRAHSIDADALEAAIWADCAYWARHPDEGLAEAQEQLRTRLGQVATMEQERRHLRQQLAEKDEERARVMTLYRRKKSTLEEAERDLDAIQAEAAQLRTMLDAMQAQDDLAHAYEQQYTDAKTALTRLARELDEIERTNNLAKKREVIEWLVAGVRVKPEGRGLDGRVSVTYRFRGPPSGSSQKVPT